MKKPMASSLLRSRRFFVIILVSMLVTWFARSVFYSPYFVPSASMMPTLKIADSFIASRWAFGVSPRSFIANASSTRFVKGELPELGDVVVFHGIDDINRNYVKRVVGLPGDTVSMVRGQLILNGTPVAHRRVSDFVIPLTPGLTCLTIPGVVEQMVQRADGSMACRFRRYIETLPNGVTYATLDFASTIGDQMRPVKIPAGHIFVMGDNRDDSLDSRFSVADGGIGMLPADNLLGRMVLLIDPKHSISRGREAGE